MPLYEFLRLAIEKLESSQQKPSSVDPSSEKEIDLFGQSITCDVVHNLIRSSPLIDGDDVGSAQNRTREELDYDGPPTPLESNPKSRRDLAPDDPTTKAKNISLETFLKNDKNLTQNSNITDSTSVESIVASSNLFDKQRDYRERKSRDNEESECQSDELQNGKMNPAEGGRGSKRRRVAEMHNLSERRRRDRINQKMQALQELIPNCSNKADKASMLDEAIEYLKNLKHQVQIMSMGHVLCVAPGSRHVYYAPMPHSSYMGVNFGGSPVFHVSSIHGAHFLPPTSLMGSSALRVPNHDQVPLTPSKLIMKKNSKSVLSSINCNQYHGSTQSSNIKF